LGFQCVRQGHPVIHLHHDLAVFGDGGAGMYI
jgi:hypothetical protein